MLVLTPAGYQEQYVDFGPRSAQLRGDNTLGQIAKAAREGQGSVPRWMLTGTETPIGTRRRHVDA